MTTQLNRLGGGKYIEKNPLSFNGGCSDHWGLDLNLKLLARYSRYGTLAVIRRDSITSLFYIIQQNLGGWSG